MTFFRFFSLASGGWRGRGDGPVTPATTCGCRPALRRSLALPSAVVPPYCRPHVRGGCAAAPAAGGGGCDWAAASAGGGRAPPVCPPARSGHGGEARGGSRLAGGPGACRSPPAPAGAAACGQSRADLWVSRGRSRMASQKDTGLPASTRTGWGCRAPPGFGGMSTIEMHAKEVEMHLRGIPTGAWKRNDKHVSAGPSPPMRNALVVKRGVIRTL